MRRATKTQAGVGVSSFISMDVGGVSERASLAVFVDSGTIDATVEYTLEDVSTITPTDDLWFPHSKLTNKSAKSIGTLIGAVSALRLRNAAAGTARLIMLQSNL